MLEKTFSAAGDTFAETSVATSKRPETGFGAYLKSCWMSNSSPRGDRGSSSSSDEMATTLPRRFDGIRAPAWVLEGRLPYAGSWRIFVRRSTTSSSVGVSSPPRSELSSPLRRMGERGLLGLGGGRLGILRRGARQGWNCSPRTCNSPRTANSPRTCNQTHNTY
jgi:hypothetical protein